MYAVQRRSRRDRLSALLVHLYDRKNNASDFLLLRMHGSPGLPLGLERLRGGAGKNQGRSALHGKVRLVFFTFDLLHDNPEILQVFAESYKADRAIIPWDFIGSWSNLFLEYTLRSFGQEISARTNAERAERLVIAISESVSY